MNPNDLSALREHYNHTDTSESMQHGTWETDVQGDPWISVTVRFRKSDLDRLRGQAADQGVSVFNLIAQRASDGP